MPYELQLAWAKWMTLDRVEIWAVVFYALQVADAGLTYVIVKLGGVEKNPLARKLMDKIGLIPVLVGGKVLACASVYFGARQMGADAVMAMAIMYVAVVIWNIHVLKKQVAIYERRKAAK